MCKITFWNRKSEMIFTITCGTISILISAIGLFITTIYESILSSWPFLLSGSIFIILVLYLVLFDKELFAKVSISDAGIEWQWYNKLRIFITWDEMVTVRKTYNGRRKYDITFVAPNKQINVCLSQKRYNAIIQLCPNEAIKTAINNIPCLKWYQKNNH